MWHQLLTLAPQLPSRTSQIGLLKRLEICIRDRVFDFNEVVKQEALSKYIHAFGSGLAHPAGQQGPGRRGRAG